MAEGLLQIEGALEILITTKLGIVLQTPHQIQRRAHQQIGLTTEEFTQILLLILGQLQMDVIGKSFTF